jgi:hypothetical protein
MTITTAAHEPPDTGPPASALDVAGELGEVTVR